MSNEPMPLAVTQVPTPSLRFATTEHDHSSSGALAREAGEGRGMAEGTPSLLLTIHHHLRGRYVFVVILGLILGSAFAIKGWKFEPPLYHSEGLVRIAYSLPEVMLRTDQNEPMAMFETIMSSQRTLITSRRVVDAAIADPVWEKMGRPVPTDPDKYFSANLRVDRKPRSEFIEIVVTDADPGMAAAAVNSIINAYAKLYNSQEEHLQQQRIALLEEHQNSLRARISQLNELLHTGATEYGTTRLDLFYEGAAGRLARIEETLSDVTTAMATAPAEDAAVPEISADPHQSVAPFTAEQIAVNDATMRRYLDEQLRSRREMERLFTLGLGSAHKSVLTAKGAYDEAAANVNRYLEMYREFHTVSGQYASDLPSRTTTAGKSLGSLRADQMRLTGIRNQVKQNMVEIGAKRAMLDQQSEELAAARAEFDKVSKRIDQLQSESSLGGRLNVIATGEIALSPEKDRRLLMCAGGGIFGALLPTGLLLFVSFSTRRYRCCADTEINVLSKHIPVLGVLPELSPIKPTAEHMVTAAKSVHQIRMSLQTQAPREGSSVYLVTSATAGEGKTTVTMCMGLSFAGSRLRTLVIDADMVGRSLTKTAGDENEEGLHECIEEGKIDARIRKMEFGPSILSAGRARASDACTLSIQALRSLIDEARKRFDVILIDSGPILGSLEAAILAPLVDGVIVAISRGQERHLLERAMLRLNSLRANVVGCIFNRARQHDYEHSQYASNSAYPGNAIIESVPSADAAQRFSSFGPLVQSVAAAMPAGWN